MENKEITFKQEFKKNMYWGILAFAFVLIFFGGFYLNVISSEITEFCGECYEDQYCADNDIVCGDFGIYWLKTGILVGMSGFGCGIILINTRKGKIKWKIK